MDVGAAPSVELWTAVEEHLHQSHHPGIVKFDAGNSGFADGDGQSDLLKQREVDVHVQRLGFKPGEPVCDRDQFLAQALQVVQLLVEAEVLHPIDADLYPKESAELLVHAANQVLAVNAQDVMAMIELFQHAMQLAT